MIVLPPLQVEPVNVTTAAVQPLPVAVPIVGALGTVDGIATALVALEAPVPAELIPLTTNVYEDPFVRPVTVIGDVEFVAETPVFDVAIYEVNVLLPVHDGAEKATATLALPLVTAVIAGAPGLLGQQLEYL